MSQYTEDDDEIIVCDTWNMGVHQSCYGKDILNNIPHENWVWQRCVYVNQKRMGIMHMLSEGCVRNIKGLWLNEITIGTIYSELTGHQSWRLRMKIRRIR